MVRVTGAVGRVVVPRAEWRGRWRRAVQWLNKKVLEVWSTTT